MISLGAHPTRLDLYVHAGDPIDFAVPVLDGAGVAQSLSGWTADATVTDPDGALLHDFAPVIADDQIRVTADSATTAAWTWTWPLAARLRVTATSPGGGPLPIATGWVRFYPV